MVANYGGSCLTSWQWFMLCINVIWMPMESNITSNLSIENWFLDYQFHYEVILYFTKGLLIEVQKHRLVTWLEC